MDRRSEAEAYDAFYYAHGCGTPYGRDDRWLAFFDSVAERIVVDIGPGSVLDVGCAMGFLVEALRARGVDAFGIDVSPYAIEQVVEEVRPYCAVGRATDPFAQRFDLVTCIEVLEHLGPGEIDAAIANICAHTDDVLFSSTPFDFAEVTHKTVQSPDQWAVAFARHGFVRDVDFDAGFLAPWAVRFRRLAAPWHVAVAAYERRVWQLEQERHARRELAIELRNDLAARDDEVLRLRAHTEALSAERDAAVDRMQRSEHEARVVASQVRAWESRWRHLEGSMAWSLVVALQELRARAAPVGSRRERLLESGHWWARFAAERGPRQTAGRLVDAAGRSVGSAWDRARRGAGSAGSTTLEVADVVPRPFPGPRAAAVDVIVCVHDALDDARRCLDSVLDHTSGPYSLVIVDDGSAEPTARYLSEFATARDAVLVRNDDARGYTRAANQALAQCRSEYAVLLNSDAVVGPEWLDRLVACAESDDAIGLVGPLSNTASWQSVPEVSADGDWAENPLPPGLSVADMAGLVARDAARHCHDMPFLNGFCLLVRRRCLEQVGPFDEATFGDGYGEENDFALRARSLGWRLALADDVYVYHAQSRSYSSERRIELCERANGALIAKHGAAAVEEGVARLQADRVLEGLRARAAVLPERLEASRAGRSRHEGRRVLFLLPTRNAGGGANIVLCEARAMLQMGVDAAVFNLDRFRDDFEAAYPEPGVRVLYGRMDDVPRSLAEHVDDFDAMVATIYASVGALREVGRSPGGDRLRFGYYIQDFEPYFFEPGSDPFHHAWQSYRLLDDLVRFTKTEWNRRELELLVGVDSVVVGPSYDADLYRPRPAGRRLPPSGPVRVAAMIRPESPYRSPQLTMEVLRDAARRYGSRIDVVLFGVDPDDPAFRRLPHDFAWRSAGLLRPTQMARLLGEVDVFADFSTHQAMGLTALEAMASGVATIVPARGGATAFARDRANCLMAESTPASCGHALAALVEDHGLRDNLARQAIRDAARCYPEAPALAVLDALFPGRGDGPG